MPTAVWYWYHHQSAALGLGVVVHRNGDDVGLGVRVHADHLVRLIEVPGDAGAGAPRRSLHGHALPLHEPHLGEVAHVDDADRDLRRLPVVGGVEPGAGRAGVGADRHQEAAIGEKAEHAHVARHAVDGGKNLQILGIGDGDGIERVDPLGGDGVGHFAADVEGRAAHGLVLLAEVEAIQTHGIVSVGDVPRLERVLGVGRSHATRARPSLAGQDDIDDSALGHLVVDVGHLELVADRAAGLELGVAADGALGIAYVDDGHHRALVALVAAATDRAGGGIRVDIPVLDDHQGVRGGGDGDALEVLVVAGVVFAELDAPALEDLQLVHLARVLGVGHVEGIDPGLLFLGRRRSRVGPAVVVGLRNVGNDVDSVLDLARHTLAELADDVGGLDDRGFRHVRDVDGHQLRDVVALELRLAVDLCEVEGVTQERVDRGARNVHLDGIAEHGQARDLLGVLGIRDVEGEEAAVGVEVEEVVAADLVDVRLLDLGHTAAGHGGAAGRRGPGRVRGRRRIHGAAVGRRWQLFADELGGARPAAHAAVHRVDRATAATAPGHGQRVRVVHRQAAVGHQRAATGSSRGRRRRTATGSSRGRRRLAAARTGRGCGRPHATARRREQNQKRKRRGETRNKVHGQPPGGCEMHDACQHCACSVSSHSAWPLPRASHGIGFPEAGLARHTQGRSIMVGWPKHVEVATGAHGCGRRTGG